MGEGWLGKKYSWVEARRWSHRTAPTPWQWWRKNRLELSCSWLSEERNALWVTENTGEPSHWNEMPTDKGLQSQKYVLLHLLLNTLLFYLSLSYLKSIQIWFLYMVGGGDSQLTQHNLLKRLTFPYWTTHCSLCHKWDNWIYVGFDFIGQFLSSCISVTLS